MKKTNILKIGLILLCIYPLCLHSLNLYEIDDIIAPPTKLASGGLDSPHIYGGGNNIIYLVEIQAL